ncbi:MAG: transcription antitermination factor NusB [Sneathiellaceae bacterium]
MTAGSGKGRATAANGPAPAQQRQRRPGARTFARLAAVQALYQIEQNRNRPERVIEEFERHRLAPQAGTGGEDTAEAAAREARRAEAAADYESAASPEDALAVEADRAWFRDLVTGVSARQAEIDGHLNAALAGRRDVMRMEVTLRAILRAGVYELLARIDTPTKVVIAEYVALAYDFFNKTEADLVNAILDRIGREVRHGA